MAGPEGSLVKRKANVTSESNGDGTGLSEGPGGCGAWLGALVGPGAKLGALLGVDTISGSSWVAVTIGSQLSPWDGDLRISPPIEAGKGS